MGELIIHTKQLTIKHLKETDLEDFHFIGVTQL
jgi:hypothetical protein